MKKKLKKQLEASPSTRALFDSVFNQMVETSKGHGYMMAKLEALRAENNSLREQINSLQGHKGLIAK
jgi:cell division protein FtsB